MTMQHRESLVLTTKRLLKHGATGNIKNLLGKLHAADAAYVIDHLDSEKQDQILELLFDSLHISQIFSELGSGFLEDYIKRQKNYDTLIEILQKLPSDDITDLVGDLPEEMSNQIISRLQEEQSQVISELLQYQETTAGGLMSTEVFKVKETATVGETIRKLQRAKKAATFFFIYVVDEFNNLVGVLSIKQLFQVETTIPVKEIMLRDVVRVKVTEPQEEVARVVAQYDLVAVPVVDENNKLAGVITVDDVIDVIREEAAENVLKMGSAEGDILSEFSFSKSIKKRLPWFLMLFVGGIFTCEVITYFYKFLPAIGVFAGFIPLILRFSGIIARQTSTILIQGISSGKMKMALTMKVLREQGSLTILLAILSALLVAGYTLIRFGEITRLPLAVSLALFCSMIVALILGVLVPLGFSKIKLDLTRATGSLINFVLDVFGLLIYFSVLIKILNP